MKGKWGAWLIILSISLDVQAQGADSLREQPKLSQSKDPFTLLVYNRTISDAKSNFRFDQSAVANFKFTKLMRVELGIRHGERAKQIGAYDQYKVELQSKTFFNTVKFVVRMSDVVFRYGSPNYSRTNYLFIAETKHRISRKFDIVANVGYSFSYQKNNVHQGEPIIGGPNDNHGIYKFAIRYKLKDKGYIEGLFGTYDVFNPYRLQQPFYQLSFDYELFEGGTLYSYFRYQYDNSFSTPLNDFLGLGIKVRIKR